MPANPIFIAIPNSDSTAVRLDGGRIFGWIDETFPGYRFWPAADTTELRPVRDTYEDAADDAIELAAAVAR